MPWTKRSAVRGQSLWSFIPFIPGCRIYMLFASGSGCSGCMAPSRIIPGLSLQMPDIQLLMLSTWSGRVATERRTCMSCRLMWWWGVLERGRWPALCCGWGLRYFGPAAGVKGGWGTGVCGAAVWGRVALCLAGIFCDWLGGNIEKYEHGA